ncbi:LytR C-terminal domain-containing protein [Sanguibacter sp. 25GB23B1]|uniref:LytR C-terminal domain-containing protein n=1 Tax=unclassified Sanguibacter TaxID=2645534 RepID=UPI0032AEB287
MTTPDDVRDARALRRRHKHERQAVIFGVLIASLAVTGLAAVAVYTGTIDPPFDRGFSSKDVIQDEVLAQPCLPEGTFPVAYNSISVNVLNATDQGGLASTTSASLAERGFTVATTGNTKVVVEGIRISFGSASLGAAYTLAAQFEGADLYYDAREDASVDVILGSSFEGLKAPEAVQLDPTIPMVSREGCVAMDQINPQPLPTVPPTEEPVEEVPAG